ncbi:agmatine deiminase [Bacteroidota bacterium]|nr:agmatine deiminase [Bacteroidota bacterium]
MFYRLPAEWEKQDAIQFTFPHADSDWKLILEDAIQVFVDVITAILPFEKVIVVTRDIIKTKSYFKNYTSENLFFFDIDSNDTWARDHGGITVSNGLDFKILDFTFNGWGQKYDAEKDNLITEKLYLSNAFKVPLEKINFVLEGGAIETDGLGTLITTRYCMQSPYRNPSFSEDQINNLLLQSFGTSNIYWLNHGYLAGDDTDSHIDTLVRFCNPTTLAYVKCDNQLDEHYDDLLKMEAELMNLVDINGNAFHLVPLPWPDACFADDGHRLPATYANFLIINGAVLLPIYNVKQDQEAVNVLSSIFPERKIIPVLCRTLIEQHGSLHCISMQYPEGSINL